jgi:hypothetical protein
MPTTFRSRSKKHSSSKRSKRVNRKQKVNKTKKINKSVRKMKGGGQKGGAGASVNNNNNYTKEDIEEFYSQILIPADGYYFAQQNGLNSKYFEQDKTRRHGMKIKPNWKTMINECYNSRGQTPLYVALRFNASFEMINMLITIIDDVNRINDIHITDGSSPFIGLCIGKGIDENIEFTRISSLIPTLNLKNFNFNIESSLSDEFQKECYPNTGYKWLDYKSKNNLIKYS